MMSFATSAIAPYGHDFGGISAGTD